MKELQIEQHATEYRSAISNQLWEGAEVGCVGGKGANTTSVLQTTTQRISST